MRHDQTPLGEFKNCEHLLACYAWEPLQEIIHTGPVFEILEKRLHWHAGAFEEPHSTDFLRSALYNRTLVLIEHRWTITAPVQRKDLNQTFFGFEGAGVSE